MNGTRVGAWSACARVMLQDVLGKTLPSSTFLCHPRALRLVAERCQQQGSPRVPSGAQGLRQEHRQVCSLAWQANEPEDHRLMKISLRKG